MPTHWVGKRGGGAILLLFVMHCSVVQQNLGFSKIHKCDKFFSSTFRQRNKITSQRLLDQNQAGPHVWENTTYLPFWSYLYTYVCTYPIVTK